MGIKIPMSHSTALLVHPQNEDKISWDDWSEIDDLPISVLKNDAGTGKCW